MYVPYQSKDSEDSRENPLQLEHFVVHSVNLFIFHWLKKEVLIALLSRVVDPDTELFDQFNI